MAMHLPKFGNLPFPVALLLCSLLVSLLVDSTLGSKDKDDDDDYDDDDEGCYPGRNCIPGCYCGAEAECRPYFFPKSPQHGKWKCRPFNYPKWKVHRKGSKYDGVNSSLIYMPHLHQKSDSVMAFLAKNNYTAFDELAMDLSAATLKLQRDNNKNGTTTSTTPGPAEELEPSTLISLSQEIIITDVDSPPSTAELILSSSSSIPKSKISRSMRFLQRHHSN